MKIIARMIVILSKFFSMIEVPDIVPLKLLARASLMPVPLPEWSMIMMTRPTPDINQRINVIISKGLKANLLMLYYLQPKAYIENPWN
jgi:hypothetical protein